MIIKESVKIGDKVVSIETGRVAKQAAGSIIIRCGETVVLCTVCGTKEAKPFQHFLPLTVDYVEKTYAAGKIPGGFFKREGRLRENEVLTSRLIDRPFRPLFPDGYRNEIQVIATVISADGSNLSDTLAMTGCSAALHASPIPWAGPVAGVRVGRVDGKFIANPTVEELAESDCDLLVAASRDAVVMVEGGAEEMNEEDLIDAVFFGKEAVQGMLTLIEKLREEIGQPKWAFEPPTVQADIRARVEDEGLSGIKDGCKVAEKFARYDKFDSVKKEVVAKLEGEFPDQKSDIKTAYGDLKSKTMRSQILFDRMRVDGRDTKTVRPINIEVGWLPRTHGSTLFTRGETQAIVTTTLGTRTDEQKIDGLLESYWKRFMLHYNFPPFSVGEARFMRGPGRREIGHGNLAERALAGMMPDHEEFPYTIRVVSEITESNGSSSMASVCGAALSMMDAGVPIKAPVAGVAMGLIKEGDEYAVLTDILGDEDHLGDMDFKVCGTAKGITAIQMDIKIKGLSQKIMEEALEQARDGRLHILDKMNEILDRPREEMSKYAPKIHSIKVKPDQIRLVIGPGGKMIKAITDQTGCAINVADDGTVSIAHHDQDAVNKAIEIIEGLTTEPEVGKKYKGAVRRVERYGAFIEIAPGQDGLLHISDFAWEHVDKVEDHMNLGDEVEVVVSSIDRDGKIKLSRKELIEKPEGYVAPPPRERSDRGDRGGRFGSDRGGPRGGDRDRGGRGGPRGGDRDRGGRGGDRDRGPRGGDRDRGPRGGDSDRDREAPRRRRSRDDEGERSSSRDSGGDRSSSSSSSSRDSGGDRDRSSSRDSGGDRDRSSSRDSGGDRDRSSSRDSGGDRDRSSSR
ncbi:MAG: polyribonucleotide nucleotidyltransferase, partial [Deltaproteobacteria bacterium]